ncbi:hypothetical protein REPUB_Repub06bG0126500 [Reevesia pubescens]
MFRRMISYGIVPGEVSLASILFACANVQSIEQGKQAHCLVVKFGLEKSIYARSALIDIYAKCGAIGQALKVLCGMPQQSVVSMNAMIYGYAPKVLEEAIIIFRQKKSGIQSHLSLINELFFISFAFFSWKPVSSMNFL